MIYKYKGNKYLVLDDTVKMKDPGTGLWVEAVAYVKDPGRDVNQSDQTYVRLKTDFEHKFEKDSNQ